MLHSESGLGVVVDWGEREGGREGGTCSWLAGWLDGWMAITVYYWSYWSY